VAGLFCLVLVQAPKDKTHAVIFHNLLGGIWSCHRRNPTMGAYTGRGVAEELWLIFSITAIAGWMVFAGYEAMRVMKKERENKIVGAGQQQS
jgi:hypothetical protein